MQSISENIYGTSTLISPSQVLELHLTAELALQQGREFIHSVQGGLYHRLDHLVPGCHGPWHLQLYFYDTEDETLSHRSKQSPDLDINIIRNILRIL